MFIDNYGIPNLKPIERKALTGWYHQDPERGFEVAIYNGKRLAFKKFLAVNERRFRLSQRRRARCGHVLESSQDYPQRIHGIFRVMAMARAIVINSHGNCRSQLAFPAQGDKQVDFARRKISVSPCKSDFDLCWQQGGLNESQIFLQGCPTTVSVMSCGTAARIT